MIKIYGIKNCDTMKKARKWLEENKITHDFFDYRTQELQKEILERWVEKVGWEVLLNTRGTTWRKLSDNVKKDMNKDKAIKIMFKNQAIIKRPVLEYGEKIWVGFSADKYADISDVNFKI